MARRRRSRQRAASQAGVPSAQFRQPYDGDTQPIGYLNGRWSILLRLVLVTTPIAWTVFVTLDLPWRIWVTHEAFKASSQGQLATCLGDKLEKMIDKQRADYREIQDQLRLMPPDEWRRRVADLEFFDRQNRADHAAILVSLEAIKVKLNISNKAGSIPPNAMLPWANGDPQASYPEPNDRGGPNASTSTLGPDSIRVPPGNG